MSPFNRCTLIHEELQPVYLNWRRPGELCSEKATQATDMVIYDAADCFTVLEVTSGTSSCVEYIREHRRYFTKNSAIWGSQ